MKKYFEEWIKKQTELMWGLNKHVNSTKQVVFAYLLRAPFLDQVASNPSNLW